MWPWFEPLGYPWVLDFLICFGCLVCLSFHSILAADLGLFKSCLYWFKTTPCMLLHAYLACCYILGSLTCCCMFNCIWHAWMFAYLVPLHVVTCLPCMLECPCCILHACLGCIAFSMLVTLTCSCRISFACMLASLAPWINYDRGWRPLICFVCIPFDIEIAHLTPLGHHALKCVIDGPRVGNHTPLSRKHDKECGGANIALKMLCHALSVLCCC